MSEMKCPECGGEIILKYKTPDKVFSIADNRSLARIDQNKTMSLSGDDSYIVFDCENDSGHDLSTDDKIVRWTDKIEEIFYGEGYHK